MYVWWKDGTTIGGCNTLLAALILKIVTTSLKVDMPSLVGMLLICNV